MPRLFIGLGVAAVVFVVYAVVDCALFDRTRTRGLSRGWWIVVIVFVPVIGAALWFIVGRGRVGRSPSGRGRTIAPDDDVDFLRHLNQDSAQNERIRRLEQELAELGSDEPGAAGGGPGPGGGPGTSGGRGGPERTSPDTPERTSPDTPETPGEVGPSSRPNG